MLPLRFPFAIVGLIVAVAGASAQAPPAPEVIVAGPSAASATAPAPAGAPDMVKLQYPNSDVQDILRLYGDLTGLRVITDNFVQGKVNIFLSKDVPREEAIKIIEMNLLLNGFSLVPAPPDIMKVLGQQRNPRGAGIPIISDPSEIPSGDRIVTYLFKLRYADPTEMQQVLGQYLSPPQPYTSFLALPKSSSILVTENSSVIRQLAGIIDQIDVAPAEVVSEFIPLQRADATKVVEMLKDVFDKTDQQTRPGGFPAVPGNRNIRGVPNVPQPVQQQIDFDGGAVSGLSEDSIILGKIKISADVRTNRIHVVTRPVNMPFIRRLISEFDANVEFAKPVTRPLRYVSAGDVLPVLVQALTEPGSNDQNANAGGTNPNTSALDQQQQRRNNSTVTSPNNAGQSSTASDSNLNISEELSTQPVDTAPKAVTVGNSKIIADQRSNSIIIIGTREIVVKVQKILDEMDIKAPQVALSTVIGELSLNNDEAFGVDYLLTLQRDNGGRGGVGLASRNSSSGSVIPAAPILDPSSLINFTEIAKAATGGTNIYVAAGNTLKTIVQLLDSTGRFKTISRPTVFTSNNKKAIIASGTEIPVPVNTISSSTGGGLVNTGLAQQTNIQFKKVALQLEVVPLINSEKEVSLDILQKIDSVGTSTKIDNNFIPNINTRYIRTNVTAPNCGTIVLGGLIQERNDRTQSGIPVLDRLPVIGSLFRTTQKNKQRQELIVLLRPEVSLTKMDLFRLRQKHEDRTHLGSELEQDDCPDCPKPGDGKELPVPDVPSGKDFSR